MDLLKKMMREIIIYVIWATNFVINVEKNGIKMGDVKKKKISINYLRNIVNYII
jgi:NOL1/NOP2/fmu family ribosome biogenesis protein